MLYKPCIPVNIDFIKINREAKMQETNTSSEKTMELKDTLNLPKTDFPMRGGLPQKEPNYLKQWADIDLYHKVLDQNKGKAIESSKSGDLSNSFYLHDGPPYANGEIHMGTALNKVLKDIVIRYNNMNGKYSPYVPGWDCHGLPIELGVEKKHGKIKDGVELVEKCRNYALDFVARQKDTFKRLGVYGEWDKPYLTINKSYESNILRELAKVAETGAMYQEGKPVYWCHSCVTALAEAEVEYHDHSATTVLVKFKMSDELKIKLDIASEGYIIIWTTTPWTLPANLAVALHPRFEYGVYEAGGECYLLATDLSEDFEKTTGKKLTLVKTLKGAELDKQKVYHPFNGKESLVVNADYVTLEAGTGCVHIAPGHGMDDYIVGKNYGLDIYNPVNDNGIFVEGIPLVEGMHVNKANKKVVEHLEEIGALIHQKDINHSYPHCWRCKKPIIFRATPQWFISMEKTGLREKALSEIKNVDWIPSFGEKRIYGMIEGRPDWCVSRQRRWGVPIPAFKCQDCEEISLDSKVINHVADLVAEGGVAEWYKRDAKDLLPEGYKCPKCGGTHFSKGRDILDVWFDSGVSYSSVVEQRDEYIDKNIDLYLEGSDQHRGWFHTSLLESVLTRGKAPYKKVLTHGFVVDGNGRKMSKSLGNTVAPQKLINQYGADILRLWVAHEDFAEDISYSDDGYKRVTEAYRRIRNTIRFLLGSFNDFNPAKDRISYENLRDIDKFTLHRYNELLTKATEYYNEYKFYKIFHLVQNFCTNDLSAFYLDISKDSLYTEAADSKLRRGIQTVNYEIAQGLIKLLAPILVFTTEEAYSYLPELDFVGNKKKESIHLTSYPKINTEYADKNLANKWQKILEIKEVVSIALEEKRKTKEIGHSLDAVVSLTLDKESYELVQNLDIPLRDIFIVSDVIIEEGTKIKANAQRSTYEKCDRCWQYKKDIKIVNGDKLCGRCETVLKEINFLT